MTDRRILPARMPVRAAAILVAALTNPLAASSDGPSHPLAGVVWISPSCAGPQLIGDLCRAPLAGVEVRLSDDAGHVAASATTDAKGAFAMRASSGRYRLHVAGVGNLRRCPTLPVTLPMAKPEPVALECDSGMR